MKNLRVSPRGERALAVLTGTVVSIAAIAVLYWAQSILIPVALAVFLTFLLSPLVSALRGLGMRRTPAVIVTVCLATTGLGMAGWLVTTQISGLLYELPAYTENVTKKVRSIKAMTLGTGRLGKMIAEINTELGGTPRHSPPDHSSGEAAATPEGQRPAAVVIEPQVPLWVSRFTSFLTPIMEYLGELALAGVLVVFMLQKREELRNRIISLIGHGRIALATKFVDEAGQKISRFLLMQAIVNGTFGVLLSAGLLAIGVKYALVWGFLGASLRDLPYIGPYLAAVPPICLSLAMFDGWAPTLLVIALYLTLELVVANAIEPWLYGQSMGVSEIALLVSAAFWAFLWGPIGLVLSSPLTVCLVVLGRYVPHLRFLAVLLGDERALDPGVSFFQRCLRDQDEAGELLRERQSAEPGDAVYDSMLVPALSATKLSQARGEITEADAEHVVESIRTMTTGLAAKERKPGSQPAGAPESVGENVRSPSPAILILGCPARTLADRAGVEMLANLLDPSHWRMEITAAGTLASELLDQVTELAPAVVAIMAVHPGGRAHARYLCKRLRPQFPDLKIIVCCAGRPGGGYADGSDILEAGADAETKTLQETRRRLASLRPILRPGHPPRPRTDQLQCFAGTP